MARHDNEFQTITSEGGLLPPDLFRRILDPNAKLEGTTPADYGLPPGERLNEGITQSWNRLRKHWTEFRAAAKNLPEGEPGTGLTNDKWSVPLLRELGFGLLPASTAPTIDGKTYAINRFFGATAIHLVGCGLSLDRRTAGARGAAAANPHGLLQDFLNRSPANLWGILSNGLSLRILRDTQAISRQSYLDFDLEAMFDGEVFSDFVLMWLMGHATRFAAREDGQPESCWLERWTKIAQDEGTRALGELRGGVERALQVLGQGFVGHPKNTVLRDSLRTGQLTASNLHGQLLRIVYRLIFLFVAEDRTLNGTPLLHPPDTSDDADRARERYATHYSAGRLRELAGEIRGSRHGDLWRQFNLIVGALSIDERFGNVRAHLSLPILGSFLWSPDSTAALNAPTLAILGGGTELANADFLEAIQNLAFTRQDRNLRPVDYKHLGAEELGGVYESLLALTPQVSGDGAKFTFAEFAGNERKTSGSYYTPDSLVQCLLDSALKPVVDEAIKGKSGAHAEEAILALKVCDPAVGSGHFLVGAAHRLSGHLARIRAAAHGEGEPSPAFYQHALRDVIGRCLYGVDINPMAAELCRVSLWLEALEPGKPLSFLDHHIRVGNSLLGTTPELIAAGLPDGAFDAIKGDDKKVCAQLKKRNRAEREGFEQGDLLGVGASSTAADVAVITLEARKLDETPDDSIDSIRHKANHFQRLIVSPEYMHTQQVADAWCAAFVWPKIFSTLLGVVTTGKIKQLASNADALTTDQQKEVERLSSQYQFFHWHLAFPEVFARGGFDCVLGNPPWERLKLQEQEFFSQRDPAIASAPTAAARKRAIANLELGNPSLLEAFRAAARHSEGESHIIRNSGRFPLCGRGDINTYAIFSECSRSVVRPEGRFGLILPTGIATDDTTKLFFGELVTKRKLVSYFGFKNERFLFPRPVEHTVTFGLLTVLGSALSSTTMEFCWLAWTVQEMKETARRITMTVEDIERLNPNTRTCPVFRSEVDAELTKAIYRRVPVLIRETDNKQNSVNPWGLKYLEMFHSAHDSDAFLPPGTTEQPGDVLLQYFEAKQMSHFDHRWAVYVGETLTQAKREDAEGVATGRHLVPKSRVWPRLAGRWEFGWRFAWRDVTRSTDIRTLIAAIIPEVVTSDKLPVGILAAPEMAFALVAMSSSFCLDYAARQKLSGTGMKFYVIKQLPVFPPQVFHRGAPWTSAREVIGDWVRPRALELIYTAWDLESFGEDCGYEGPPFRWHEERRFLLRSELDAAFFHLYLPSDANGNWVKAESESEDDLQRLKTSFIKPRDAVEYIMETFPIVKKKDIEKFGDYRTKLQILDIYDEMQQAMEMGVEYRTKLDPPPGDPRCCHPARDAASV